MENLASKSACKIVTREGELVAEVKQKQSTSGIVLGEDVMTLVVEPNVDHSLIMSLVVHPQGFFSTSSASTSSSSSSSPSPYITSQREVFTIWMKSLVMNSNGCTVYDSNGHIVYRIDNYDKKCSNKVYLMDLKGQVLSTILRKKLRLFGRWEGYNGNYSKVDQEKPWFQVRKPFRVLKANDSYYDVTVSTSPPNSSDQLNGSYKIEISDIGKFACRILDQAGVVVAEVKQKQSSSGVVLGDDVLTLVVEPNVDHSLIMGLMVVHGLINRKL
ncbi:Initiation factor 2B-related [Macleaya cordata]|uniref:Initiation factor 2B-related n=1 Tax=Macleaya cordata TaxID=56857 RepID=A0A200Q461_MACCD|nr:Initiation factor 2B-related [Macleaya cordata]